MPGSLRLLLVWCSLPTSPADGKGVDLTGILLLCVLAISLWSFCRARRG